MECVTGIENPILSSADIEDTVSKIFERIDYDLPAYAHLIEIVKDIVNDESIVDRASYDKAITQLRRRHHIHPKISSIRDCYLHLVRTHQIEPKANVDNILLSKKGRSHSGVLVITVLTSPGKFSCPKDCYYCPNEVDKNGKPVMPRSYISTEPACRRATQNRFDPVLQFFDRARTLEKLGHTVDKIELLVLGGTWSFYPQDYQQQFIRDLYYAANVYYDCGSLRERYSLKEEQLINESTTCRVIGLTLETRPDYITLSEIKRFRDYGCTRVQLGVQHIDDNILEKINRECPTRKTVKAIELLKENCFKVDIHLMPDLPDSTPEMDMEMFEHVFNDERFQADDIKVYFTMVTPFTVIEKWYNEGLFKPYCELDDGKYARMVLRYIMENCPKYIRINRCPRDIPVQNDDKCPVGVIGGLKTTNIRQIVEYEMLKDGVYCKDIRSREVKDQPYQPDKASLQVQKYRGSRGDEYYLSVEMDDGKSGVLYGHLRLRLGDDPFNAKRLPSLRGCALIRELHVYGVIVKVNEKSKARETQHTGIGKRLLAKAEEIALQNGYSRIAVISGVGVRNYYRARGYTHQDEYGYLVKELTRESINRNAFNTSNASTAVWIFIFVFLLIQIYAYFRIFDFV